MDFSFFNRFLGLRVFLLGVLISLSSNLMAQNCPQPNDFQIVVKDGCGGQNNGQITIEFNYQVEGIIERRVGLYAKNQSKFLRNQLNTNDMIIEGKEVSYYNIPPGEYQIAFFFKDCPDFPKPEMYPSDGIVITNKENCGQ